jgi:hypothetical protein
VEVHGGLPGEASKIGSSGEMVRVKRRISWTVLLLLTASALWALTVEVTYEHNVRHIPADFRQHHQRPEMWKA